MKLVITPRAQAQIEHQLSYGIERHGLATAQRTFSRVDKFLRGTVLAFPRTGSALPLPDLFESIIPRTPFVVIYRIEAGRDVVRIVGFFHNAQDRSGFAPSREDE